MTAWTEYTDCPTCDKPVAVHNPRHGDGTIRLTYWHKRRAEDGAGEWCRAEVDVGDHELRRTRVASAQTT